MRSPPPQCESHRRLNNLFFVMTCIVLLTRIFGPAAAFKLTTAERSQQLVVESSKRPSFTRSPLFSASGLFLTPNTRQTLLQRKSSVTTGGDFSTTSTDMAYDRDDSISYGPHVKVKGKVLTLIGFLFIVATMTSIVLVFPLTCAAWAYSKMFDPKRRLAVDWVVGLWAKLAMGVMGYRVRVEGAKHVPRRGPVMICPNHTSFLDILTLSAFLPKGFKYVSKREILRIPFIGWTMQLAGHIPVMREDSRSQLETVKNTIVALKDGCSILMFPEGTRSQDGRLQNFKQGPFSIATKAGATILPVSICNVPKWFPATAAMPLRVPNDVVIRIHPPISAKGMSREDLLVKTFGAIASGLPAEQKPIAA